MLQVRAVRDGNGETKTTKITKTVKHTDSKHHGKPSAQVKQPEVKVVPQAAQAYQPPTFVTMERMDPRLIAEMSYHFNRIVHGCQEVLFGLAGLVLAALWRLFTGCCVFLVISLLCVNAYIVAMNWHTLGNPRCETLQDFMYKPYCKALVTSPYMGLPSNNQ